MKARFVAFILLCGFSGVAYGVLVPTTMLVPMPAAMAMPEATNAYAQAVMGKGAEYGAGLGLMFGVLLFYFTLGETPTVYRRGSAAAGHFAERFDFRRLGSTILPLTIISWLVIAFLILPRFSESSLVVPRSMGVRLFACFVFSFIWISGTAFASAILVAVLGARK
jgi:hypothetical protein